MPGVESGVVGGDYPPRGALAGVCQADRTDGVSSQGVRRRVQARARDRSHRAVAARNAVDCPAHRSIGRVADFRCELLRLRIRKSCGSRTNRNRDLSCGAECKQQKKES